jgi:hypothetical protein
MGLPRDMDSIPRLNNHLSGFLDSSVLALTTRVFLRIVSHRAVFSLMDGHQIEPFNYHFHCFAATKN